MALFNIAPTKSSLLALRRQLAVAEEGYELLEQKRQILVFELMSRLKQASEVNRQVYQTMASAYSSLREATLDIGTRALNQAAQSVNLTHQVETQPRHLMGLRLPRMSASTQPGCERAAASNSARASSVEPSRSRMTPRL